MLTGMSRKARCAAVDHYLTAMAEGNAVHQWPQAYAMATIAKARWGLVDMHVRMGEEDPIPNDYAEKVLRKLGRTAAPPLSREPFALAWAASWIDGMEPAVACAVALGGVFGFRRSEYLYVAPVVGRRQHHLRMRDVLLDSSGHVTELIVHVPSGKGDQQARGSVHRRAEVPGSALCPVKRWRAMVAAAPPAGLDEPAFRRADGRHLEDGPVNAVIKDIVHAMGLDAELYSTHSLRVGFATMLYRLTKDSSRVAREGRWRSRRVVETFYIKLASTFDIVDENITSLLLGVRDEHQ
jgi:hypothetical protein